jgi:hypothetical protein
MSNHNYKFNPENKYTLGIMDSFSPYKHVVGSIQLDNVPYIGNYYIPRPRGYVVPYQYQIGNPLPELNKVLNNTGMWNPRTDYSTN